jgi:alanyl-tRNA synthetase
MKSSEIRNKFLEFFESKGHQRLPGSSLIPSDPTVLLTLAGMLQFKPIFLGQEKPSYKRATTVQKCMRMNDIENVGVTPRHHTFFEMLGNFSFGDYFKKEAIQFAWELLAKEFKIPVERLKIAVYEKDDEAYDIWHEAIGLPKAIIYRLGEDNNFWAAGPTGPCGPCSEIYYDLGEEKGCGKPDCAPGCDCDRFLEIWNLVFISYNRDENGELHPLKQKGIDTGMGLERIAAVLQGADDNFGTDLFVPLMKKVKALAAADAPVSVKIVADHIRAITNLIADGVFPSNMGRGYVLRRLVRRAVSHGKRLGINKPFLYELAREVVADLKETYPQLAEKEKIIVSAIKEEEDNFFATLEQGMKWFAETARKHGQDKLISGEEAFKLHDTYGFPVELTVELAGEQGIKIDLPGFERAMEAQRERARRGHQADKKNDLLSLDLSAYQATNFTGYEKTADEGKVVAVFSSPKVVVLDKTPFYGESGGQVGDTGIISADGQELRVLKTYISRKVVLHEVDELKNLQPGTKVKTMIDVSQRKATEAHHTATHLLHKALRELLGEQVKQAGSYVGPDKLRFDFSHFHGLSLEELQKVEQTVNRKIAEKIKVEVLNKSYKEAVALGAMALFGEKYGDQVRVLKIGSYSLELCGGTHVKSTADIRYFKIISEGALGSGVRRIEALAGLPAKVYVVYRVKALHDEVEALIEKYRLLQSEKESLGAEKSLESSNIFEIELTELDRISKAVDNHDSVSVNKFLDHLGGRADWLKERIEKTEREIEALKEKQARSEAGSYLSNLETLNGVKVLLEKFDDHNMDVLRTISDTLQGQAKSCVLVLASSLPGRLIYLITVTPDLAAKGLSAKKLAGAFSAIVGGKGGGKETKVEGGGKDPARIKEGFSAIRKLLEGRE